MKEGWVLAVPYDAKHGVGTPYLKPAEVSSSSKGNKTIKRYDNSIHVLCKGWEKKASRERLEIIQNSEFIFHYGTSDG